MLQAVVGFVYGVVESSWIVSTIALKYIIGFQLFYLLYRKEFSVEKFREQLMDYSREIVSLMVLTGTVVYIAGLEVSAGFKIFSEFVALSFYAYLFWKY